MAPSKRIPPAGPPTLLPAQETPIDVPHDQTPGPRHLPRDVLDTHVFSKLDAVGVARLRLADPTLGPVDARTWVGALVKTAGNDSQRTRRAAALNALGELPMPEKMNALAEVAMHGRESGVKAAVVHIFDHALASDDAREQAISVLHDIATRATAETARALGASALLTLGDARCVPLLRDLAMAPFDSEAALDGEALSRGDYVAALQEVDPPTPDVRAAYEAILTGCHTAEARIGAAQALRDLYPDGATLSAFCRLLQSGEHLDQFAKQADADPIASAFAGVVREVLKHAAEDIQAAGQRELSEAFAATRNVELLAALVHRIGPHPTHVVLRPLVVALALRDDDIPFGYNLPTQATDAITEALRDAPEDAFAHPALRQVLAEGRSPEATFMAFSALARHGGVAALPALRAFLLEGRAVHLGQRQNCATLLQELSAQTPHLASLLAELGDQAGPG